MKVAQFEVTFLSAADGGRASLVHLERGGYAPHLIVADGPHLGVRFLRSDNGPFRPGVPVQVSMEFLYETTVDYSALETLDPIGLVEGNRLVGWVRAR